VTRERHEIFANPCQVLGEQYSATMGPFAVVDPDRIWSDRRWMFPESLNSYLGCQVSHIATCGAQVYSAIPGFADTGQLWTNVWSRTTHRSRVWNRPNGVLNNTSSKFCSKSEVRQNIPGQHFKLGRLPWL